MSQALASLLVTWSHPELGTVQEPLSEQVIS